MANDNVSDRDAYPEPASSSDLKALGDRLVGTWKLSGDTDGTTIYEWMEGGFFFIQRMDFKHDGHEVKGIEVIGHLRPFGEEPGKDIRSRVYDSTGNTFDYVYEITGDTLTIWGGERGSPAYFKGKFSNYGDTITGEWIYPGGGYKSTMIRARQ